MNTAFVVIALDQKQPHVHQQRNRETAKYYKAVKIIIYVFFSINFFFILSHGLSPLSFNQNYYFTLCLPSNF